MNFTRACSMVLSICGNIPGLLPKVQDTMEFIKEFDLEKNPIVRPWFLYAMQTASCPAGTQEFAIPEGGFLAERYKSFLREQGQTGYYTKMMPYQEDDIAETLVNAYILFNSTIKVFPLLNDRDRTFEVHAYWATNPLKESAEDNPWLVHAGDWLVALTAERILTDMQNVEAAAMQRIRAETAKLRVEQETIERMAGVVM